MFLHSQAHSIPSLREESYTSGLNKKGYENSLSNRGNYTRIVNELITSIQLDCTAKCIFMYILMQNEGWKGSCNNIAKDLQLDKRTVTRQLRFLDTLGLIKIHEGEWQWFFEIMPPEEWSPVLKEEFNKKLGACRVPRSKKKNQLGASSVPSTPELGTSDVPSDKIDETLLVHSMHQPRYTGCANLGTSDAPHIYTKDLKTKENFLEEDNGDGNA